MKSETFVRRSRIAATADEVFAWHARPGALQRLNPPWQPFLPVTPPAPLEEGLRVEFDVPLGPFRRRWVAQHEITQPGRQFRDIQQRGLFAQWEHTHTITPEGDDACILEDRIEYVLPLGVVGKLFASREIRRRLERTFAFRHRRTAADLGIHTANRSLPTMNILVSGSSGLVGSSLVPLLTTGGHTVTRLVRSSKAEANHTVAWDPNTGEIEQKQLEGYDAVVHLAGENIASGRWNAERKARIRDSRVVGTRHLCEALARCESPPRTLVCASAIGMYGNRGSEELDEHAEIGSGFLADVCRDWEAATEPARKAGIRVVSLRIGVVLSPEGGALKEMLTPFRLGGGGTFGNGKQYWSWIALDDVVGIILHALTHDELDGPVNCVSPNSATNREFTKTLGHVLRRPTILPLPAFAARLALGEMADELMLASTRVVPNRLQETDYQFQYPELEDAFRHLLGK